MILPGADRVCDRVAFGILGTFPRVYKWYDPETYKCCWWIVGCWLVVAHYGLLCSHVQRKEKKKPDVKDETCPEELSAPNQQEVV